MMTTKDFKTVGCFVNQIGGGKLLPVWFNQESHARKLNHTNPMLEAFQKGTLTDKDFRRQSDFIYSNYGIKMPPEKRTMLEGRLAKRLRANQIASYSDYCD